MGKNKKKGIITRITIIGGICVFLIMIAAPVAKKAYDRAFERYSEETYQEFYQTAYEAAEKKNHTQNDVDIIVGNIKEEAKLEVLQVSGIEYIIHEGETEAWISVRGSGTYTVNLTLSEFVIDKERQYVLARVPKPQIENVVLGEHKQYLFENGVFNGNISEGIELALEDRKTAQNQLRTKFASSQTYYEMAECSAEKLIKSMVESLNPKLPELVVEIEFTD